MSGAPRYGEAMALIPLLQEPELRPFLPLLYVAWADGDLSDAERALIHARIAAQPWLKPRLREALTTWLLPASPPNAQALASLRSAIVDAAPMLSADARHSFAALAESMAALAPNGHDAVAALEDELGFELSTLQLPVTDAPPPPLPPRFDASVLQSVLDGRFADARAGARTFLSEPANRALYGVASKPYREQVFGWLGELAKRGFGALAFPGVTTDASRGLGPFLAVFETLGYGDLSLVVKFGVQFGLWGGSIYYLGTDAQRQALLPKVANLEAPGCFAMSEVGHGSNVADLETVVRWDEGKKRLVLHTPAESARKDWAGNAAMHARYATVFAQLEVGGARHGVHAFVVPIRDEQGQPQRGVRIGDCGHKLGLNGVDNGRLWFDHVELPRDALLGRYATVTADGQYQSPIESPGKRFFTMLGTLVGGRIAVASAGLSASKLGLAVALRYGSARRQFGATSQPETLLLDYPTHQRRLFPHLAQAYALHFAIDEAREAFLALGPDDDTREIEAHVAGVKTAATWHASAALQACREACGAQGYLSVNRLADARADADIFTTFEGDNTVLLQLVARGLLTGFKQQFSKGGAWGAVRFVAGQLRSSVAQTNPFTSRNTDEASLRSADMQLAALRFREASLLSSVARRLRKRLKAKGTDPATAFLEVQEHLLAAAQAHVEVRVLSAFINGVQRASGAEREALNRLRELHGLCVLERHTGWFLENGAFEAGRARAVRRLVPTLFCEVRPDVLALVEAWGIPDACLAAPIAYSDPAHPRW